MLDLKKCVPIFLLISQAVFAQTEIDSLTSLYEKLEGKDLDEIMTLNDVAKSYVGSYPSLAERFARKALKKSVDLGLRHQEARAYLNLGDLFLTRSDLIKAREFGFFAFSIFEELADSSGMAVAANNIGRYYADNGEFDRAFEYYNKSLSLNSGNTQTQGNVLNNIGSMYHYMDEFDSAEKYFNQALEIRYEIKDQRGLAITLGNIGIIHAVKLDVDKAIDYYTRSIEMKKEIVNVIGLCYSYINMGNLHRNIGKYDDARNYYQIALAYTDTAEAKGVKSATYLRWSRSERLAGNEDFANELLSKSQDLQIEVMEERQASEIRQLEASYNLEKKERELVISEQNVLLLEKDQRIRAIQIVLLILALGLMITLFFWQRTRNKKKQELQEAQTKLLEGELEHKNNELSSFTINFIQKQDMMEELNAIMAELKKRTIPEPIKGPISNLRQVISKQTRNDKEWEDFRIYFEKVHNNFFKNLKSAFPELSVTEMRLAALIKLKLSIKETASVLGISPDSVKTARYRLRGKLNLEHEQNLTNFLIGFS